MGSKEIPVLAEGSLAVPQAAARRDAAPCRCAKATSPVLRQDGGRQRALTVKPVPFYLEESKPFHQPHLEHSAYRS